MTYLCPICYDLRVYYVTQHVIMKLMVGDVRRFYSLRHMSHLCVPIHSLFTARFF